MDDYRILFLINQALTAFNCPLKEEATRDFLTRNNGENAKTLTWFVEDFHASKSFDDIYALIFFHEDEIVEQTFKYFNQSRSSEDDIFLQKQSDQSDEDTEIVTGGGYLFETRKFRETKLFITKPPIDDEIKIRYTVDDYFFVIRENLEKVPKVKSMEAAILTLPNYFETGYIQTDLIHCNAKVIQTVYSQMLAYYTQRMGQIPNPVPPKISGFDMEKGVNVSPGGRLNMEGDLETQTESSSCLLTNVTNTNVSKMGAPKFKKQARDEFCVTIHKYASVMDETINSLEGHFVLESINFELPTEDDDVLRDVEMSNDIVQIVHKWTDQLDKITKKMQSSKANLYEGPLTEVEHWRTCSCVYTGMAEELKLPVVTRVINLYERITERRFTHLENIKVLMYEAKDNVRFLTLVERHFKNVQFGSNFEVVTETIAPMMQSLRLIWTISRNYNKDERLGPLLQMIAGSLCDRVSRVLEIHDLFLHEIDYIMEITTMAKTMLECFVNTYLSERKIVETTAQDNRWEFDRKLLFGEINYMRDVCDDIYQMVKSAKEFYKLFGPELKNITGDSESLDQVLALVDGLFGVVTGQDLVDPFRLDNKNTWIKLRETYQETVEAIDQTAKNFINDYFSNVQSSINAFDLLLKLKAIQSRKAISDLLKEKYQDVLRGFSTELMKVDSSFQEFKDNPIIAHYAPPVTGAIAWSRLIFETMKIPILRFLRDQADIYETTDGIIVKERYMKLGRCLRDYEIDLYSTWYEQMDGSISVMLNQPILRRIETVAKVSSVEKRPSAFETASNSVKHSQKRLSLSSRESSCEAGGDQCRVPSQVKKKELQNPENLNFKAYTVNFDERLWLAIAESKYMEVLDLQIPEIARILGLQEQEFTHTVLKLRRINQRYNVIVGKLDRVKVGLLQDRMDQLCVVLEQGTWMLNWDSLPCEEYICKCEKALQSVEAGLRDIEKCEDSIEEVLKKLLRVNMFKKRKSTGTWSCPSAKAFIEYVETQRESDMRSLSGRINTEVCSFLQRLEESLYMTKTGECHKMQGLYVKYETRILHNLIQMVEKNMWLFVNRLDMKTMMFYVDVILVNSDVVIHPVVFDLYKWLRQSLRGCIESTRFFIRWKRGSCEECPPVRVEGQDMPFIFSHWLEIERLKQVYEPEASFDHKVKVINHYVVCFLKRLARFSSLWRQDKQNIVEKWVQNKPITSQYEHRIITIIHQTRSIERIIGKDKMIQTGSIALRLTFFYASVMTHRREWIRLYLRSLLESAQQLQNDLEKMMSTRRALLDSEPTSLDEMKNFLNNIAEITGGLSETVDNITVDIDEKYRIIRLYGDELDPDIWSTSKNLLNNWSEMVKRVAIRAQQILPTKARFAEDITEIIKSFCNKVAAFIDRYRLQGPGNETENLDRGISVLAEFSKESTLLDAERVDLLQSERLLDLPISTYPELKAVTAELEKLVPVYDLYSEQKDIRQDWSCVLWKDLNVKMMEVKMEEFNDKFKEFSKKIRLLPASRALLGIMKNFTESLELLVNLKNDALRDRHWKKLMETTGISFDIDPATFTMEGVFAMEIHRFSDEIAVIVGNAQRELQIEKGIEEIKSIWIDVKFSLFNYQRLGTEAIILGCLDTIQQYLEDHMVNLQSMASSRFAIPFFTVVRQWEKDLTQASDTIDAWLVVQRKWMYLESIFMAGDIAAQLPHEAKRFAQVDKSFRNIMQQTMSNPHVLSCCLLDKRLQVLFSLQESLDLCQKALNEYLDSKRNAFPRFFFISDDELLSILGGKDPEVIQEHIIKMFDNISSLRIVSNIHQDKVVQALISAEGEVMDFRYEVIIVGRVEEWMLAVEAEMRRSNYLITKTAIFYYCDRKSRTDWIFDYQGMVVLASTQVWFTWEVEDVFRKIRKGKRAAMKDFAKKMADQITGIVFTVRGGLGKNDMKKFETVLIIDVHARDIVDSFIRDSVTQNDEFEWESQLRFYWVKKMDKMRIRQCSGEFGYGNEYFGLNGRLVITPLTDRIYLTLTQALSMNLGGAPAGPAGTGKTESTKDLAKALGLLCVVTNCGEGMDFKSFGKLLSGLCQCGAWGCFDEFNRIDVSVLSVVSTQIKTIQNALAMNLQRFTFEGDEIKLDSRVGCFITMNPGYAGRTELPESVKALFRPVVVIVPDLEYICEIMLFSQGFLTARNLAKKMTTMYKLAREQLSKQHHYDFGLRALKAVLVMAGDIRRANPNLSEEKLLMRALRDINLPKFVYDDVPLFRGLITDLFPGLIIASVSHEELAQVAQEVLLEEGYTVVEKQVDKIVQFYSTILTRHSVMIVGPTCGGKTVVIQSLCESQTKLGLPTKLHTLNPKERTVHELYGLLDPASRDWTDGLLSSIFRKINGPIEKKERRYLLFDGDVDALWIENMNSVMDDNRLLTLVNGERIRLQNYCSLLFEVGDLQYASPATVSRCGMVYVDPKDLGYDPYWIKWLSKLPNDTAKEIMSKLYTKYIHILIEFIFEGTVNGEQGKRLKAVVPQNSLSLVIQLCNLLDSQLTDPATMIVEEKEDMIDCVFVNCILWSLGAALIEKDQQHFDEIVKQLTGMPIDGNETDQIFAKAGFLPSLESRLSDYTFDIEKECWIPWKQLVPEYKHDSTMRFTEILVPTVETVKIVWILNQHIKVNHPIVLIGETGTSKTATLTTFLRTLSSDTNSVLKINFSSRTSSMDVQRNLESNVEKWAKGVYGPTPGKTLLIFVDDLNMPKVDEYGTQQPIALLKLLVEKRGMYDRGKELFWKNLKSLAFLAAMGLPGGGRNDVDPRFLSLFSMYHCASPSETSLTRIFGSILKGHTQNFVEKIRGCVDRITDITINTYNLVKKRLMPTPAKFHYTFNLRDLSKIFQGLCLTASDKYESKRKLIRLWRHECTRVFGDRMISVSDNDIISDTLMSQIKEHFYKEMDYALVNPLLFGDYWSSLSDEDANVYEDMQDYDVVQAIFQELIESYNDTEGKLNLVLFNDALEHLSSIYRIIRMDGGHALLVGVQGSGKRSLTRLAAFAANLSVFEISLTKNYREKEFREDLKNLYIRLANEDRKDFMFLFGDQHVAEEGFLELINNMLTTGMVPALFADDERDELLASVWDRGVRAGYLPTTEGIWQYFQAQCAARLHIVLSMSPVGDTLRRRCRNFPGVVNNTTIDWYFPWPEQALYAVACYLIDMKNPLIPKEYYEDVICHVVKVHNSVECFSVSFQQKLRRANYVTATNYIDYIKSFLRLLSQKDIFVDAQCRRLEVGLNKLEDTAKQIKELNARLAEQKVIVEEKKISCEALMVEIEASTVQAKEKKLISEEKTVEITQQSKVIAREQTEAAEALTEAQPALDAAKAALDELDKNDVTEIRAFSTPPKTVQTVGECLCFILQATEISWKSARGLMADASFIMNLQMMDVEAIPNKNINGAKDLISKKKLTVDEVRSASKAGAGFLKFILSVIVFYDVAKEIRPKRERVKQLEKEYNRAKKDLAKLNDAVEKLEEQLRSLRKRFEESTEMMEKLNADMKRMELQLLAANKLTTGLASEKIRWTAELKNLNYKRLKLLGDCLLASAFLSYLGPFTWEFRYNMFYNTWYADLVKRRVPLTQDFKVQDLLTNEVEISLWNSQGLPPDELSIQNAILTTKGSRSPLCIDPQEQAVNWIKKMEKNTKDESKTLRISTFNDTSFLRNLENGIKFGTPFLFEDVGEIVDPVIDNVLSKNIQVDKGREFLMLGDREVDWESTFRLYLTCKMANPRFSPNLFGNAMVINYTVTVTGLEGQLLSALVKYERRELEERREKLIQETSENKRVLKELEDRLLLELATQTGNILDNWDLINTLEDTKAKAVEVAKQLDQAVIVSADVETQRDGYRLAAKRGAILFFVLADLAVVDSMYQFSLSSYLVVFLSAIKKAMPNSSLMKRLNNIINTLTYHVYCYGCTGIFEKHKLLLSFQLAVRLQSDIGNITQSEVNFFIKGNVSVAHVDEAKPADWILEDCWRNIVELANVLPNSFPTLIQNVRENCHVWKEFYEADFPELHDYPLHYNSLNPFLKLCLLRCWRIDRVPSAVAEYVTAVMDRTYVSPPITTFSVAYASSMPTVPVVVIVSPGCDPPAELVKLADSQEFEIHRLKYLSMGQGQEANAVALLENAVARGHWLMLQNAHLLIQWLPALEKRIDDIYKPHPDFRLWLTTEPVSNFPIGILQKSYKLVMEPPSGLKQNLHSTIHKMPQNTFLQNPHSRFRSLIFTLAFLHAILQERRRYGKIGWNVPYDFSDSDFQVSVKIIDTYLTKAHENDRQDLPWGSIKYLIGEVMYGGRAIDYFDRRILTTYMDEYFGDFLFDEFQPFYFYYDDEVEYSLPEEPEECSTIKEIYTDYIKTLPFVQRLGVFGLSANAMIGYSTTVAKDMWRSLIELQPESEEADAELEEDTINEQEKEESMYSSMEESLKSSPQPLHAKTIESVVSGIVDSILVRLPVLFDVQRIRKSLLAGEILPTSIVLLQELDRFNLLLRKMFISLNELKRALVGEAGMSHELDDILRCLHNGLIPKVWRLLAPNTEKSLGNWIDHLIRRNQQYINWVSIGKSELPVIWLPGLHIPESYLTAVVQKACRKNGWALDRCTTMTSVTIVHPHEVDSITMALDTGCNIYGLYIEGAAWDVENGCLIRQPPRQLVQEMPVIKLIPVERHKMKLTNTIRCPVYVTSMRRNAMGVGLVTELDLFTVEHSSHWILMGIALTLNTD